MKHNQVNILSCLSVRVHPVWATNHTEPATALLTTWGRTEDGQELGNERQRVLDRRYFLVTNWHVVTGMTDIRAVCGERMDGAPQWLKVDLMSEYGRISTHREPLYSVDGCPLWTELRRSGERADLIALPLTRPIASIGNITPYVAGTSLLCRDAKLAVQPGEPVSIVGFPFGYGVENYPIWKTGHLASDLVLDHNALWPTFLVDITTRPGMSGSPVYAVRYGLARLANGAPDLIKPTEQAIDFLGIYSGKAFSKGNSPNATELGVVWKRSLVRALLQKAYSNLMGECSVPRHENSAVIGDSMADD